MDADLCSIHRVVERRNPSRSDMLDCHLPADGASCPVRPHTAQQPELGAGDAPFSVSVSVAVIVVVNVSNPTDE